MSGDFDYVVVGAGIVGSCAAWHLAKTGKKILLLEQFHLPHTRGSSHGQSRLIRSAYEERHYASIMPDAFSLWKEIERDSGTTLIQHTKVLGFCNDEEKFAAVKENCEIFAPGQTKVVNPEEYLDPELIKYPKDYKALLDSTGGVLLAHKAVTTVQSLFKKLGGEIRDGIPVTSIENVGNDVKVTTSDGIFVARAAIVCAGAWTSKLFNGKAKQLLSLYTKAVAVKVYYWKIVKSGASELPSFLDFSDEYNVYGLTSDEYPGLMKVCAHGGTPCDPNEREKAVFDVQMEEKLKQFIKERFPMLEPTPAVIESCMYTVTPDEDFIIDQAPTYKNIYVGCGFSGTGFKTATIVGKLLSELALGLPPSHDLTPFSLNRFN